MGEEQPGSREAQSRTPADEVEIKKSFRKIRKALGSLIDELKRRRNKNALWKF
jgi:hypothetical protein